MTRKQFKVVATYLDGATQKQVGAEFRMSQPSVSQAISRAVARVPALKPLLESRRRRDSARFI